MNTQPAATNDSGDDSSTSSLSSSSNTVLPWTFPKCFRPTRFLLVSEAKSFWKSYAGMQLEVISVLVNTFLGSYITKTTYDLSPAAKRMIVTCAELAVEIAEVPFFKGRACTDLVDHNKSLRSILMSVDEVEITPENCDNSIEVPRTKVSIPMSEFAEVCFNMDESEQSGLFFSIPKPFLEK